jgi:hypothetical protein
MATIVLDIEEIERLAGLGLTFAEICDCIGISERTLYSRKKTNSDVAEAIKRGRSKASQQVSNKLFELCMKGNLGAIVWYQKTRCGINEDKHIYDRIEALEKALAEKKA